MPLNFNGRERLEKCLPGMLREAQNSPVPSEVWVIDNHSQDGSRELVESRFPGARFVAYPDNRILAAYNEAAKTCSSPFILLLNNDVELGENFIAPLYERLIGTPGAFAVSPRVNSPSESECYHRRRLGRFFHGHLAAHPGPPGAGGGLYLHGGATLVRRDLFVELGGFDDRFFYMEDLDLSYRAWRKGWSCIFEPKSELQHFGGATTTSLFGAERKRGIKEKANNLFVLKQVQNPVWLVNFLFWSVLKLLKMVFTLDRHRFWAWAETLRLLPSIWRSRQQQDRLDDRELMSRIATLELEP